MTSFDKIKDFKFQAFEYFKYENLQIINVRC